MVRMKRTARGTPTGLNPAYTYEAGVTYSPTTNPPMSERLADVLVRGGLAEYNREAKVQPADYERKVTEPRTDTASMTVQEVLQAVETGELTREAALTAERAGKARTTLLSALQE